MAKRRCMVLWKFYFHTIKDAWRITKRRGGNFIGKKSLSKWTFKGSNSRIYR